MTNIEKFSDMVIKFLKLGVPYQYDFNKTITLQFKKVSS